MSWQLASFLLLAAALLGGFAWYERSHPSSRVLALVGTLAALAVLGRIAFAAIPNVKPTTDIVLLAGYVFGGAPGFAVGAVSGFASNFFFTQGPWTPWQMLAWGGIGVFGALLAWLSGGRLGRIPLALACGLCGLGFGVVVNFGSVVTYGDVDLWPRYTAYQSVSLPWDLVHAGGNVIFYFLFGPALVRTLRRFRTRFEFSWKPSARPAHTAPLAALALAAFLAGGVAKPSDARAAATPVSYLERAQNPDGGFGGAPGQASVDLFSGWAGLGLAAQGVNPRDVARGPDSVVDYVARQAGTLVRGGGADRVGDLERTILLVSAAGLRPRAFAGHDLVAALTARFARDGSVLQQSNLTAFGILALRAAGTPRANPRLRDAAAWLARQQNRDGGFGFATRGGGSDVDDAAAAVQALVAAGGHDAKIARAVAFVRRNQNPDGGFPLLPGGSSNAQSTGWAIQAFVAAGVRPAAVRRRGSRSALAYLRSLIGPDGAVQFSRVSRQTPVWVTGAASVALAQRAFPLAPVGRASRTQDAGAGASSGDGPSAAVLVPIAAAIGVAAGVGALVVRKRASP